MLPFDDFRKLLRELPVADADAIEAVRERDRSLTKPLGSLGRLEEIAEWLAAWQRKRPQVRKPLVAVFAGNHGVVDEGVTAFPATVTKAMVDNFAAGGAAINQICAANNLGLKIFDLALDIPTENFTRDAALSERDCAATMAFGMEAIAGGTDLLCVGEMGIGNTTSATAIMCALLGGDPDEWVGPGAGASEEQLGRKRAAIRKGLELHRNHLGDPLEVLRRLGGREIAAMAGAILAARFQGVPVLIDGFVSTAAALVWHCMEPRALDHCMLSHRSAEPAHAHAIEAIGKRPILDLGMRLGEGTGAAVAAGIVRAAAACHTDMATFSQAGIEVG